MDYIVSQRFQIRIPERDPKTGALVIDPVNLYDTPCHLAGGGGSLGLGTNIVRENFVDFTGAADPSISDLSVWNTIFSLAYQRYDPGKTNYGSNIIFNVSPQYLPQPNGPIFVSGGP